MKQIKRVWRYIRRYKGKLFIVITCMLVVQFLGLLAPLLVKSILDDQLVGIMKPWYETTNNGVYYNGKYYTQEEESNEVLSIVIYEGKYYAIYDFIEQGEQTIKGDKLIVELFDGSKVEY